jgi:hypothetical protein
LEIIPSFPMYRTVVNLAPPTLSSAISSYNQVTDSTDQFRLLLAKLMRQRFRNMHRMVFGKNLLINQNRFIHQLELEGPETSVAAFVALIA